MGCYSDSGTTLSTICSITSDEVNGESQWTLGHVALHEWLHHGHTVGGTDRGENPNIMRSYYFGRSGKSHGTGRNMIFISPEERLRLDLLRTSLESSNE